MCACWPLIPCPNQMCHVSSWSSQFLADNNHVTARRDPKLREYLHSVLMDDEEIAPRICKLATIFGCGAPCCFWKCIMSIQCFFVLDIVFTSDQPSNLGTHVTAGMLRRCQSAAAALL